MAHEATMGCTALARKSATCSTCGLLSPLQGSESASRCPRCDGVLHARKVDSLSRTWALLIAGYVLFIPANLLPITITSSLVGTQADTIMSGVAYFWHEGAYDLAIIIFTASIFVPLLKLLSLTYLAWSAQKRMTWEPMQRTRLYRMVEFVGKWSMLDVFVVAMLARLVQFSALASIEAGPGALAFASVVVLTMFAAMSFDPRLIWDAQESTPHSGEKRG
jgi:paraquat-inducible protein A